MPPELVELGRGSERSTARRPPAAWGWSCRRGSGPVRRRAGSARWSSSRSRRPRGTRGDRRRRAPRPAADGRCCGRSWRGRSSHGPWRRRRAPTARRSGASRPAAWSRPARSSADGGTRSPGVGAVRGGVEPHRRTAICAGRDRLVARCSHAARPADVPSAPRRDRLGQDGGLPRGGAGGARHGAGARSCSSRRSR